ncbi:MAG: hypothetical protein HFI18_01255 [Lachnospiraceae bacterium]|nr:hypothetical protein [Lachnospiraceae bacterium]
MAVYTESYRDLCHGTDTCSAEKIRKDGFLSSTAKSNWCGDGTYFYDIKAKAWWAAHRKCRQIQKDTGIKLKAEVIFADIININKKDILDMRVHKDLCDFERALSPMLSDKKFHIEGIEDEQERIICLRALLISYFSNRFHKKLVIGNFRQRVQSLHEHAIEFADCLDMVFGIETIYCVKDNNILKNIR